MLTLVLPPLGSSDPQDPSYVPPAKVLMEHSLGSMSKWESKHEQPFIKNEEERTNEELLSYFELMLVSEAPDGWLERLNEDHYKEIIAYVTSKQTATWFREAQQARGTSREVITSEIIYYWMIELGIPFECDQWHLHRLMTLIKVISLKREKPKKMPKNEARADMHRLNEQRKAALGTTG